MKFSLCSYGTRPKLEITSEEFRALRDAKTLYGRLTRIEENFDAVLEDYVELEETLFHFGMRHLAFSISAENIQFNSMRSVIDRRILHLMSAARLYREALRRHGSVLLKNDTEKLSQLNETLNDSPKQPMAFRIIEALRNYSQHHEYPIANMSIGAKREVDKSAPFDDAAFANALSAYSITPSIDPIKVAEERDLPKDVRAALVALGRKVEIIGYLRDYIEHLGSIHDLFRKLTSDREQQWASAIRSAIARYYEALQNGNKPAFILAAKMGSDEPNDNVQLFEGFFEYHKHLKRKNGTQAHLSKRYVKSSALSRFEK